MGDSEAGNNNNAAESTRSYAADLANELGQSIVAGTRYRPGELIEDEGALGDRYRASRSVVRDAVKILVGKGLLDVRRGIGTRVRARADWALWDSDILAWHQQHDTSANFLPQLMELRLLVEPQAAFWAAQRGSDEHRARIMELFKLMEQEKDVVARFVDADVKFHIAILRAAGNDFLAAMESIVSAALVSSIRLSNWNPSTNEESLSFHRVVAQAIAAGNAKQAQSLMRKLLADAEKKLFQRLKQDR